MAQISTRRRTVMARTPMQDAYIRALDRAELIFGIGPAGTGKTYLAVAYAAAMLERGNVERLILSRPAVEAGERLGFLPGDMREKVDPYLRPLYDALYDMMPADKVERGLQSGMIEVAPLAFMRGRTLANAVVILDEAQNTTSMQMKMFLTRLGESSRMIVTGDPSQIDLPPGQISGLVEATELLRGVAGIAQIRFTAADVVRHPLVARIVDAYDNARRRARRTGADRGDDGRARRPRAGADRHRHPRRGRRLAGRRRRSRRCVERAIAAAVAGAKPRLADARRTLARLHRRRPHAARSTATTAARTPPPTSCRFPARRPDRGRFGPLLGDIVLARETIAGEAAAGGLDVRRPPHPSDRPWFPSPLRL